MAGMLGANMTPLGQVSDISRIMRVIRVQRKVEDQLRGFSGSDGESHETSVGSVCSLEV